MATAMAMLLLASSNIGSDSTETMASAAAQRFQMTKTRQKLHKKICEIVWVRLILGTIWQVSERQRMQSPETEIMPIC